MLADSTSNPQSESFRHGDPRSVCCPCMGVFVWAEDIGLELSTRVSHFSHCVDGFSRAYVAHPSNIKDTSVWGQ